MAADDGDNPVDHDGQGERGEDVGGDGAGAGGVGVGDVHVGRRGGARQDERPFGAGGFPGAGQAEREQGEHDHQQVQQQRLDDAGGLVVPDGEHVLPLGVETDIQRAAADQPPAATPPR